MDSRPGRNTQNTRSSPRRKNIPLYRNSELRYQPAIPAQGEGRSYVVTNVGRGAVDAAEPARMWRAGRDEPRELVQAV